MVSRLQHPCSPVCMDFLLKVSENFTSPSATIFTNEDMLLKMFWSMCYLLDPDVKRGIFLWRNHQITPPCSSWHIAHFYLFYFYFHIQPHPAGFGGKGVTDKYLHLRLPGFKKKKLNNNERYLFLSGEHIPAHLSRSRRRGICFSFLASRLIWGDKNTPLSAQMWFTPSGRG